MTTKLEQAARQIIVDWDSGIHLYEAITALREALAEQAEREQFYFATPHNRPNCPNCGADAPNHYAGCSRIAQSYEERLK